MISGTVLASPMKFCTVTVLLKAYQNTERNFEKSDLLHHNSVIFKTVMNFPPAQYQANNT